MTSHFFPFVAYAFSIISKKQIPGQSFILTLYCKNFLDLCIKYDYLEKHNQENMCVRVQYM